MVCHTNNNHNSSFFHNLFTSNNNVIITCLCKKARLRRSRPIKRQQHQLQTIQWKQTKIFLLLTFYLMQLPTNLVSSKSIKNNNNNENVNNMPSSAYEVILSNNRVFPLVGIGAGNIEHRSIPIVIHEALSKHKIRLVDTSRSSSNESLVARAILRYLKNRKFENAQEEEEEEIVIHVVTKVWYTHLGYERTNLSVRESLNDLSSIISSTTPNKKWVVKVHVLVQYPYCDPNISWMKCESEEEGLSEHIKSIGPSPLLDKENAWKGSWRALEEMYNAGILESIGVSNFNLQEMNTLLDIAKVKPHIYQGSIHSINFDKQLVELLSKHNVFIQVYNILKDTLLSNSKEELANNHAYGVLQRVGMSYETTKKPVVYPPSSVIMSYLLQHGYGILAGTSHTQNNHLKYNAPEFLIDMFPKLSARHDMDIENALSNLLLFAQQKLQASSPSDELLDDHKKQFETNYSKSNIVILPEPNQGVVTTFFNGFTKSIKLFLISENTGYHPIPVTVWMDPGKSKRVLASPKDVYVAYDGHGNAVKKFWVSEENGGEETFSIEL